MIDCEKIQSIIGIGSFQHAANRYHLIIGTPLINIKNVQPFSFPSKESWTLNPPKIILDLHKNKKSEVESHILKNEFLEIKSKYKHHLSVYTDGLKQDEKVACSVISPNFTDSIRLPDNSSIFTAEAKAIDIALYHIRDQS